MRDWVDLSEFLRLQDTLEAAPDRMKTSHGGVWWGVSPCPYGMEDGEDGELICKQAPRNMTVNPSVRAMALNYVPGRPA